MDMLKGLLAGGGDDAAGSETEAERMLADMLKEGLSASEILSRLEDAGFKVTKAESEMTLELEPEDESEEGEEDMPPTMNAKREKAAKSALAKHGY